MTYLADNLTESHQVRGDSANMRGTRRALSKAGGKLKLWRSFKSIDE